MCLLAEILTHSVGGRKCGVVKKKGRVPCLGLGGGGCAEPAHVCVCEQLFGKGRGAYAAVKCATAIYS